MHNNYKHNTQYYNHLFFITMATSTRFSVILLVLDVGYVINIAINFITSAIAFAAL